MSFVSLSAAIKSGLETITDIAAVYEYDNVETTKFPCANITATGNESEYADTSNNQRLYQFNVSVYIERVKWTPAKVERVMREIVDQVLDYFDQNYTLGGACKMVKAMQSEWAYTTIAQGPARVANIKIECMELVSIT